MPRPFPPEFRLRAVALVRAGRPVTTAAAELGISAGALHIWVGQDQIDRGEREGLKSPQNAELTQAKKRIRQLETEVEILWRVSRLLEEDRPHPKGFTRWSTPSSTPRAPS